MAVLELQVSPSPSSVFLWVFKTEGGLGRTIGKYKNYGFQRVPSLEGFSWNQTACVHQNLISKVPFGNITCRTCHEVWYNIDRTFVNSFFPITQNEKWLCIRQKRSDFTTYYYFRSRLFIFMVSMIWSEVDSLFRN